MTTALLDLDLDLIDLVGHFWISKNGYAVRANQGKEDITVHRFIAQYILGRPLKKNEHVHHINGNKLDNRRENLLICDNAYHQQLHNRKRVQDLGFDFRTHKYCWSCKTCHEFSEFSPDKHTGDGLHGECKISSASRRKGKKEYQYWGWKERLMQQYRRAKSGYTKQDICWILKEGTCP